MYGEVCSLEKKVVLVDGNNIAYRAFFALPLLNNDKGIHTNAIYGFTMMLHENSRGRKTDKYARGV